MSVGGLFRVLRAVVFAAVCVVLAAIGHVLMSGSPLPWWAVLASVTGVGAVAWVLGGTERGRTGVIALTVGVQTCLHMCFTLAQAGRHPVMAAPDDAAAVRQWACCLLRGTGPGPGSTATAYDLELRFGLTRRMPLPVAHDIVPMNHVGHPMTGMGGVAGMHQMGGMTGTASSGMLAAHLLAAVLCGLWLAQGERAAFRLLRALADRAFVPLLLVLAVLLPFPRRPRPRLCHRRVRRPRRLLLGHTLTTRGPPGEIAVV
ncbi:hypothetical protein J2Z21_009619 [Streptomyces griseochromogenes]|uniref:PE-PGRS family protein n=1 Tax=Streptomyces griseochromogenes TaxID=68214 RepID=A0A1B1AX04_9ACTN|nr:hypothetical protein [Streptomyces griseochromogenes]ANP51067.1 hypothetical protein AVL59_16830 [Streptomyces griseochromogenes]MBP2056600.1 hypothetical protein [Streptomyces griseochromogenes]